MKRVQVMAVAVTAAGEAEVVAGLAVGAAGWAAVGMPAAAAAMAVAVVVVGVGVGVAMVWAVVRMVSAAAATAAMAVKVTAPARRHHPTAWDCAHSQSRPAEPTSMRRLPFAAAPTTTFAGWAV